MYSILEHLKPLAEVLLGDQNETALFTVPFLQNTVINYQITHGDCENSLQQSLHPLSLLTEALYCCVKPFSPLTKRPDHGSYRKPTQLPHFRQPSKQQQAELSQASPSPRITYTRPCTTSPVRKLKGLNILFANSGRCADSTPVANTPVEKILGTGCRIYPWVLFQFY